MEKHKIVRWNVLGIVRKTAYLEYGKLVSVRVWILCIPVFYRAM